ncbi:MAG: hypothetical protein J07HQW2_01056 [Haloquadratum walsbyi J07HQW2]|uniref:Uncharacterized protein n=1 Tax=Haloquadratum walsbyi J07HQW2 TaxID=1238425 RepID=U1NCG1_9EURY|nr:MAG: hypothetical protein J07HQW2_01056 [Haloquadratum walsbyi J07HQW2]
MAIFKYVVQRSGQSYHDKRVSPEELHSCYINVMLILTLTYSAA